MICGQAVNINGTSFGCDLEAGHAGSHSWRKGMASKLEPAKTPGQVARNTYFRNASWENITKEAREEWEQVAAAVLAHARQDKRTMLAYTEFHVICKCPKCETERQGREQRARELASALLDCPYMFTRRGAAFKWIEEKIMEAWND